MVPFAKLHIECDSINPPQPISVGVVVDGKIIATCSLDELRYALTRLYDLEMEVAGIRITRMSAELESRKNSERGAKFTVTDGTVTAVTLINPGP